MQESSGLYLNLPLPGLIFTVFCYSNSPKVVQYIKFLSPDADLTWAHGHLLASTLTVVCHSAQNLSITGWLLAVSKLLAASNQ